MIGQIHNDGSIQVFDGNDGNFGNTIVLPEQNPDDINTHLDGRDWYEIEKYPGITPLQFNV
jgi:hypothetical protein